LNFLIAHYLAGGPLREAAAPLRQLLEADGDASLLPRRHDWLGNTHRRVCDELAREHPHIAHDELLRVMSALVAGDSAALPATGGTLLGRTHKRPSNPQAGALCTGKLPLLPPAPLHANAHTSCTVC
ncbi:Bromodomain and WD repeat-containing protein 3, partial [Coemansia spiralis]